MAESKQTVEGVASATPRRRRRPHKHLKPTYERLMQDLIGKGPTKHLLKTGVVAIAVKMPGGKQRTFRIHLVDAAVDGGRYYCIHARQPRKYIPADAKLLGLGTEMQLSRLYPKVLFLITNPRKWLDKAG